VGQFKYQAWVNIQGRAAFREAPIFCTSTPYALNWMYHDIYRPFTENKLSDTQIIQWRSIDNPYFPKAEYERQKNMLDSRMFAMRYEGTFQKMAGLVYEDFDRVLNGYADFDWRRFRERYFVYAGVDWGFSNPFALVVRLISKDGSADYQLDEFMRSYMPPEECVQIAKNYRDMYGVETFYCDEEAPDYILAFNNAGLKAVPVTKGKGSVLSGIGLHNTLIKSRQHKLIIGRCRQTVDEYETYCFKEKEDNYENTDENPVDANNHLMSATRYVTMATQHIRDKAKADAVFKPPKTHIQELMKRHKQSMSWEYI
jgi:phage terminase large subunit